MPATHDNAGISAWRFKLKAEIGSYEDCRAFVEEHDPDFVLAKLGPQMVVLRLGDGHRDVDSSKGDVFAVRLYDTEIIRYYPDGRFSVDNGGFNTPTTSVRLNAVLPYGWGAYHRNKKLALWKSGDHRIDLYPLDHTVIIDPKDYAS